MTEELSPEQRGNMLHQLRTLLNDPYCRVRYSHSAQLWEVHSGQFTGYKADSLVAVGETESTALINAYICLQD